MRPFPLLALLAFAAPVAVAQAPVFAPLWSAPAPELAPLGPPLAVAASSDGVLATFDDGSVHSFDPRTGALSWRAQTEGKRLSAPLQPNGLNLLYVGGDHRRVDFVYLLSGEVGYWEHAVPGAVVALHQGRGAQLYGLDSLGNVFEIARNDGSLAWTRSAGAPVRSAHFGEDDVLLATDRNVLLHRLGSWDQQERRDLAGVHCVMRAGPTSEVFALRREGVHRLRGTDYLDSFVHEHGAANCGAMDNERLWIPTVAGTVVSLAQDHRTTHWETPRLGAEPNLTRILPENLLLVTASGDEASGQNATLHVVDPETGRVLANHTLHGHKASPPVRLRVEHADGRFTDTVYVKTDTHVQAVAFAAPDPKAVPAPATPTAAATPPAPAQSGGSETPGPAAPLVALGLIGAALLRRRT